MSVCHSCGAQYGEKHQPGFREKCSCGADWHCCANCRFYDAQARQWCREPAAHDEKPRDEYTGNLCSYFMLSDRNRSETGKEAEAKRKLAELFGDSPDHENKEPEADWMKFDKQNNRDIFS